jgi:hypothetical protein
MLKPLKIELKRVQGAQGAIAILFEERATEILLDKSAADDISVH